MVDRHRPTIARSGEGASPFRAIAGLERAVHHVGYPVWQCLRMAGIFPPQLGASPRTARTPHAGRSAVRDLSLIDYWCRCTPVHTGTTSKKKKAARCDIRTG